MAGAIGSWDANKPAGTDYIDASDELIRANWAAIEVMTGALTENLLIANGATPAIQVDIQAGRIALFNSDSTPLCYVARSVNLIADIEAAVGPNGPESATLEAANKWIFIWLIYDPAADVVTSVLSAASDWSSVIKTDISGYTFARLVGAVYNNGALNFVDFVQCGSRINYKNPPLAITNADTSGAWQSQSLGGIVPPGIARRIFGWADMTNTGGGGPYWETIHLAADISGNYPTSKLGGYVVRNGIGRYTHIPFEQELTAQTVGYKTETDGGTVSINVYVTGYYVEI